MAEAPSFSNAGETKLVKAACAGDEAEVLRLVSSGINPNAVSSNSGTLLIAAIKCGNRDGAKALVQAGADPNLPPKHGDWSPIMVAAAFDRTAIMSSLAKAGADLNYVSDDQAAMTPLEVALSRGIASGNWTSFETLLALGANVNLVYGEGRTIAEEAAMMGQMDRVAALLERGYRHNLQSLANTVAVRQGDEEMTAEKSRLLALLKDLGAVPFGRSPA